MNPMKPLVACLLALTLVPPVALAQGTGQSFVLEGAVIDSRSSANLGVTRESGELAALFRSQKALTFGILRAAGIPLESLAPELRARIERFQTTNVEAFRAFSQGLDLKDQGRFAEAGEQFRRAAELDPGFTLAVEQQQAMPEVTLGAGVQIRAVIAAAAGQAVERGKAAYAVDAAGAVAAIQAGQTVVQVARTAPTDAAALSADPTSGYSTNPAGSGAQFVPNLVAGLAFGISTPGAPPTGLALTGEWRADAYRVDNGALESVGSAGDFTASRQGAVQAPVDSAPLADGSRAYWGQWLSAPGASATVVLGSGPVTAPALGAVDWIAGDATRQMPGSGTAVFTPGGGGNLANVNGTVAVDFVTRGVALQGLGFTLDGLVFSGLTGSTSYDPRTPSGAFSGLYTGGSCTGCAAFAPGASAFGGNFLGQGADGLVLSTILVTGDTTHGGVTLFRRGP
jgi:hypothetical protein